jgi:8-oxo-dGTP pyrophosphatase MutT (NUDIX family)
MAEGRFTIRVGGIIQNNATNKLLLLKRSANSRFDSGDWEMPAGRMNQLEEPEQSLKREILEETGITELSIIKPLCSLKLLDCERC